MKKKEVKKLLYRIRVEMIEEISEMNRNDFRYGYPTVTNTHDFNYGYKVGMTQAAMILLDDIYKLFPEEEEE